MADKKASRDGANCPSPSPRKQLPPPAVKPISVAEIETQQLFQENMKIGAP
jgi:hypothetical protein